jgi:hypothetical protein
MVASTYSLAVNGDGSQHTMYPGGTKPGGEIIAPDSLAATNPTTSTVDLDWNYSGFGQTGFLLEQWIQGVSVAWTLLPAQDATARSYQAIGLPSDSHVGFRVRAERDGDLSPWSQEEWTDTLLGGG